MSTLARSGNVSLIYPEYFLSYLLVPNFVNQLFLVSQYDTTIKKAFLKKFGAKYIVFIHGFCAVQLAVDKHRYTRVPMSMLAAWQHQSSTASCHQNITIKLRWLKTVIFPWEAWALTHTSVWGITRSPEGWRDSVQDLKFAKLTRNMAVQGPLCKTLFLPSLVSCLWQRLFLPSKTSREFRMKKHSLKPLCWNINKNCDVDVAINPTGYQSKKQQEKYYSSSFLHSFY